MMKMPGSLCVGLPDEQRPETSPVLRPRKLRGKVPRPRAPADACQVRGALAATSKLGSPGSLAKLLAKHPKLAATMRTARSMMNVT